MSDAPGPSKDQYAVFLAQAMGALNWAHQQAPGGLTILPPEITKIQREKVAGPNKRPATMTIIIPDKLAAQLKSEDPEETAGILYVCHVHKDLVQYAAQRAESKIVLPGEH